MIRDRYRFEPFSDRPIRLVGDQGEWLGAFPLDLDEDVLTDVYRDLVRARLLDQRLVRLQRQGKSSFVAPGAGHEAIQVGVARAMEPGRDWLYPYYRDYGLVAALGVPLLEIVAQATGSAADPAKARQMPSHPGHAGLNVFTAVSPIGAHLPPAAGTGVAMKMAGKGEVTVCTFGDGATSEGDWHTGLNFAGVQGAPVVFVCENNRYAISVEFAKQSGSDTVAEKAHAYGMPGYRVDGMDVLACMFLMQELVDRAREGFGPALVDAAVYRYGAHSSADDDSVYRPREEVEAWRRRDPIPRYRSLLERRGIWNDGREAELRTEIQAELDAAVEAAEAAGKPALPTLFDDVYAELPWHLRAQREEATGS